LPYTRRCSAPAYVSIRQHTPYLHTSAYVSMRVHGIVAIHTTLFRTCQANTSIRQHTSAHASIRQHTSAYAASPHQLQATLADRQRRESAISEHPGVRQHPSAYTSIRGVCSCSHEPPISFVLSQTGWRRQSLSLVEPLYREP
jgi:hypothetical protein